MQNDFMNAKNIHETSVAHIRLSVLGQITSTSIMFFLAFTSYITIACKFRLTHLPLDKMAAISRFQTHFVEWKYLNIN